MFYLILLFLMSFYNDSSAWNALGIINAFLLDQVCSACVIQCLIRFKDLDFKYIQNIFDFVNVVNLFWVLRWGRVWFFYKFFTVSICFYKLLLSLHNFAFYWDDTVIKSLLWKGGKQWESSSVKSYILRTILLYLKQLNIYAVNQFRIYKQC